jgi:hypothetical protein
MPTRIPLKSGGPKARRAVPHGERSGRARVALPVAALLMRPRPRRLGGPPPSNPHAGRPGAAGRPNGHHRASANGAARAPGQPKPCSWGRPGAARGRSKEKSAPPGGQSFDRPPRCGSRALDPRRTISSRGARDANTGMLMMRTGGGGKGWPYAKSPIRSRQQAVCCVRQGCRLLQRSEGFSALSNRLWPSGYSQ